MRNIRLTDDVVPLKEFKAKASYWLQHVARNRRPVLITQNGKPAGVLIDPRDFDESQEKVQFIEAVIAGMEDVNAGRFVSEDDLDMMLREAVERRET